MESFAEIIDNILDWFDHKEFYVHLTFSTTDVGDSPQTRPRHNPRASPGLNPDLIRLGLAGVKYNISTLT